MASPKGGPREATVMSQFVNALFCARNRQITVRGCASLAAALGLAGSAHAALTFNPAPPVLNHVGNLVANGSFESGAPIYGQQIPWAMGPTGGPNIPPGWSASGTTQTYATWGSDGVPGQGIRASAPLPDGQSGMYFGNLFTDVSLPPTHLPTGEVTFPGSPVFTPTFGAPCTLSQTINTPANPAPSYQLSFWVSGEDAATPGTTWVAGVMGFRMTNVLPGDPIQYLSIPSGFGGPASALYAYDFTPLNPLLPCTIEFINWGHVTTIGGGPTAFTSELVLDDVIINTIPTPGGLAALAPIALLGARRRRR